MPVPLAIAPMLTVVSVSLSLYVSMYESLYLAFYLPGQSRIGRGVVYKACTTGYTTPLWEGAAAGVGDVVGKMKVD